MTAPRPMHLLSRSHPGCVIVVPAAHVTHVPAPLASVHTGTNKRKAKGSPRKPREPERYVCDEYAATGKCGQGAACPDVHASVSDALVLHPHVRRGAAADAPRLPPELGLLGVAPANQQAATLQVPAAACLRTRALEETEAGAVPALCAHFMKKGACDFGAECRFVHPLVGPRPLRTASAPTAVSATSKLSPQTFIASQSHVSNDGRCAGGELATSAPLPVATTNEAHHCRFRHEPYGAQGWVGAARR
eukprot:CAMPEP_0174826998 /NCGR_PEP_ID=MMETSP1114-20130205/400_1 /TAXON_ID=312471 /ORGANISM="Neobodo designis, Strain CCAP 1951/1" /LENGTH=247 /DNA_ID=CAMNT_0016060585 /DNA_START=52 /DNA_END=795 /DNA_ORIENTATION=+